MKTLRKALRVLPVALAIMMLPAFQACTSEDEPRQDPIVDGPSVNENDTVPKSGLNNCGYAPAIHFDITIDAPDVLHVEGLTTTVDVGHMSQILLPPYTKTITITPNISDNPELRGIDFGLFSDYKIPDCNLTEPYKFAFGTTVTKQADGSYLFENLPDYFSECNIHIAMDAFSEQTGKKDRNSIWINLMTKYPSETEN